VSEGAPLEKVEKGHRVVACVRGLAGVCNAGHRPGDRIEVSARGTGGMCGWLYHSAFPYILLLQFGGAFPWGDPDGIELDCPDRANRLTIRLERGPRR